MGTASKQNIDFSQVKDGGAFNRKRIPAGDYSATITKVEDAKAKDDNFQYLFTIKIDKLPSSVHPYYCKLVENQLWKLRNLFIASGISIPKKKVQVDPNRLIGKTIGVTIEDDEYEGKEQSTISGIFPAAELGDTPDVDEDSEPDEGDEDEPLEEEAPLEDPDEEEAEEDEEEAEAETMTDPYATLDRAQLKAELKKRDSSFVAKKSQTDDDLRALLNAPAESDDDEDDEPAVVETKKPAAKSTTKPRVSKAKAKADTVSDDELEELDIDDL